MFRTDRQGAIAIETDGRTVWIEAFTGERATFGSRPAVAPRPHQVRRWLLEEAVARWFQQTQEAGHVRAP